MSTFDDPNRQAVGLDPAWVEGTGGEAGASEPEGETGSYDLRSHAGLDALAAERGHEWSADDLTVAQKREELGV